MVLNLYFMLDNACPVGCVVKISLPGTLAHAPTACTHWAISAASLGTAGTTATGACSGSSGTYYYASLTDLAANTAYGLALTRTASTAQAGVYAPVGLSTRMNSATSNIGPVFDTNQVFDSVAVGAASTDLTQTRLITVFQQ